MPSPRDSKRDLSRLPAPARARAGRLRLAAAALAALLLSAWARAAPGAPGALGALAAWTEAQREVTGEYVTAAREYERLAAEASPPVRQQYLLSAAESLIKGGQIETARVRLESCDLAALDP